MAITLLVTLRDNLSEKALYLGVLIAISSHVLSLANGIPDFELGLHQSRLVKLVLFLVIEDGGGGCFEEVDACLFLIEVFKVEGQDVKQESRWIVFFLHVVLLYVCYEHDDH